MKRNLLFLILLTSLAPALWAVPFHPPVEGLKVFFSAHNTKYPAQVGQANDDKLYVSEQIQVSNVYPNPATDQAAFDYVLLDPNLNAKITIRNVLGSVMGEYALDRNERNLSIPVSHYVAGVYFYTLTIASKNIVTKKLIVKR